nr:ABC transporter permease [Candidatus Solirubrobacter pratensis]
MSAAAAVAGRMPTGVRDRLNEIVSQLAAAAGLIVVCIALAIASPYFLTSNNLFNVCVQIAVVAIIAVGQTMVILTAGIDLSVGSVAGLSGVVGCMAMSNWGMPMMLGIVVGILIGAVAGVANGVLVTKAGLPPFIATLGMMGVARGLTFIVSGAVAIYGLPDSFRKVGEGQIGPLPLPLPLLYLIVIAVAGHLVLSRTRLGRYTYAIGSNKDAARLSGIPINKVLVSVYVIAGALAGFGGMIDLARALGPAQLRRRPGARRDRRVRDRRLFALRRPGHDRRHADRRVPDGRHPRRRGPAQHHAVLPGGRDRRDHLGRRLLGPAAAPPAGGRLRGATARR